MVLTQEETVDLIRTLVIKYAPPGLDKSNVLEQLDSVGRALFAVPSKPCPKCKLEMICPRCDGIDVDVSNLHYDITVRAGNRIIYDA